MLNKQDGNITRHSQNTNIYVQIITDKMTIYNIIAVVFNNLNFRAAIIVAIYLIKY